MTPAKNQLLKPFHLLGLVVFRPEAETRTGLSQSPASLNFRSRVTLRPRPSVSQRVRKRDMEALLEERRPAAPITENSTSTSA